MQRTLLKKILFNKNSVLKLTKFSILPAVGSAILFSQKNNNKLFASTSEIPGSETNLAKKGFDIASTITQTKKPLKKIHNHLHGFHFYNGHPKHSVGAHHFCSHLNDDFSQCLIYDNNDENARLIGVEFIISEKIYNTLPPEERRLWHSHSHEVKSGILTTPGMPMMAEHRIMQEYLPTFGKTFHFWHADIEGNFDELPYGIPQLMMAHTEKNPISRNLLVRRDAEFGVNTQSILDNRTDLMVPKKIKGVDAWEDGPAYQLNLYDANTVNDHSVAFHEKTTYDHIVESMEKKGSKKEKGFIAENLIEKTKDLGSKAYEKGREIREEVKKDVKEIGNFAKNSFEKGKEKVEDVSEKLANKTKEKAHEIKEKASESFEKVKDNLKETSDEVRQRNEELKRKTNDIFEGNPDFDDLQSQARLNNQILLEQNRNENYLKDSKERERIYGSEMNESLTGKVLEKGREAKDKIKQDAKDLGNFTYEKGREAKEYVHEKSKDLNHSENRLKVGSERNPITFSEMTRNSLEKGKEKVEDISEKLANKTKEKAHEIKEKASESFEKVKENLKETSDEVRQRNEELKRKTNDIFEGRPDFDDLQSQARLNNQLLLDLNNNESSGNYNKKGLRNRDEKETSRVGIPQASLQQERTKPIPHDFLESTSTLTDVFRK